MTNKLSIELNGLGRAIITAFVLSVFSAIIVYFTGLHETLIGPLSNIILIISIFYGACYVSKNYGTKGLVRGIILGLMFFIVILIATLIFNISLLSLSTLISTLAVCLISGGLGGILGIGLSE
ncbi:hypothetical protein SYNTR_0666 [Candidatus Syntrophocurvum alkaliphilum]|uniref:Uncharacterized protein n=1 Tax=Candidatus Syntrophocurvum alkaliphilum TaxID=2293317 RepID=A0A6I6DI88_9FIRM|nr:TIGR04086 family membrane protein [Candidatus Syntrophocurvum alkaliphilum]QGT99259.1 hypothetical protein SYNTR_0666 [Candidatus Syntrophocurvum alkaliphilum]